MATRSEIEQVLKFREEVSGKLSSLEKRVSGYEKKAKKATKSTGNWTQALGGIGQKLTGINPAMLTAAGAVTALVGATVKAVFDVKALGVELTTLRDKTGIGTTALQEFKFAADQSNVSFQAVTDGVTRLGRRVAAGLPRGHQGARRVGTVGRVHRERQARGRV